MLAQIGHPGVSSFRVGLGPASSQDDIEALLAVLPELVGELREIATDAKEALARFRPAPS